MDEASELLFGGGSPYTRAVESSAKGLQGGGRDAGTLTQLHQWSLYRVEKGGKWPGFSAAFCAKCRNAFFSETVVPPPSGLESSIQAALAQMGLATQHKVRTAEGYVFGRASHLLPLTSRLSPLTSDLLFLKVRTAEGYMIDLIVESSGGRRQVAIEVDGPSRFVGWSRDARGSTCLKRRQVISSSHLL